MLRRRQRSLSAPAVVTDRTASSASTPYTVFFSRHSSSSVKNNKTSTTTQPIAVASTRTPYRAHFTIKDKSSKWLRRSPSYRCVEWVFGLAETSSSDETLPLPLERIEHRVEFTWALGQDKRKTGKPPSTRVFWNKKDITHLVRRREYGSGAETTLEFSWSIKGGETLMIFVNFSASVASERDRYVLFVDGDTFTNFPTLRELEESSSSEHKDGDGDDDNNNAATTTKLLEDARSPENDSSARVEGDHDLQHLQQQHLQYIENSSDCSSRVMEYPTTIAPGTEMSFRLAMAGLDRSFNDMKHHEVKDELHSDLFSPVLEALREQITSYLPQADDVVSRAITNAFCAEESSLGSSDATSISLMSGENMEALGVEANMLKDAYNWSCNKAKLFSKKGLEAAQLEFLQRRIDELFLGIRNDCLEPEEVSRIALNVAAQTGLPMTKQLPLTTILINGIPQGTSEDELLLAFSRFGEMDSVAIASSRRFGFCRFTRPETARRAVDAYREERLARENGEDNGPSITLLECNTMDS